jgi:hypothetical protein
MPRGPEKPLPTVLSAVLPGNVASGPVPVAAKSAVPSGAGVAASLSRTIAPRRWPGRDGVNVYSTVHVAGSDPAAYVAPTAHVPPLTNAKSLPVAPCVNTEIEPTVPAVATVTVAVSVALVVPTGSCPSAGTQHDAASNSKLARQIAFRERSKDTQGRPAKTRRTRSIKRLQRRVRNLPESTTP